MTFSQGQAVDLDALMTALSTFATGTPGWTGDELNLTTKRLSLSRSGVFVHMAWGGNTNIGLYQSQAFSGTGLQSDSHTNDSGSGDPTDGTITTERRVGDIGNGPYTQHYFFSSNSDPRYIHCILEYLPGLFRHWSFGNIEKVGDWTGGDYVVGHLWSQLTAAIDSPADSRHALLWDSRNGSAGSNVGGTIHVEGLTGQGASDYAAIHPSSAGTDGDANTRELVHGFTRDGPWVNEVCGIQANPNNAAVPMAPIQLYYNRLSPNPDEWRHLGDAPDVKVINMGMMNPGDEFTVGGDTWKVFPWVRKQNLADDTEESENGGLAYKKIA